MQLMRKMLICFQTQAASLASPVLCPWQPKPQGQYLLMYILDNPYPSYPSHLSPLNPGGQQRPDARQSARATVFVRAVSVKTWLSWRHWGR